MTEEGRRLEAAPDPVVGLDSEKLLGGHTLSDGLRAATTQSS
jgi:hypothetical protein